MSRLKKELQMLLVHPYFIVNVLLCSVFIVTKTISPICDHLYETCTIDFQEYELLVFLACVITVKGKRQMTLGGYIGHFFMFTKFCNLIMFYQQNIFYAIIYAVAWLIQTSTLSMPTYKGPDKLVTFRDNTMEDEWKKGDDRVYWLVKFYTAWSPSCIEFAPTFAELSQEFGLENLRFGRLDITRYPNVALKYKIDNSSWSRQLPTVILFRGGKEIDRRPSINLQGKVAQKFAFSWENVVSAFSLNDLQKTCLENPIKKKSATTTANGDTAEDKKTK